MGKKVDRYQKRVSRFIIVKFADFVKLISCFGFKLDRVNGSHHIFIHEDISEIINIQNVKSEAKPYQTTQFLRIIEMYNLQFEE